MPHFAVRLTPPDISLWLGGNCGLPGFTTLTGTLPGPHVALIALTHGNELCGAIVLDRLLRAGLRPTRGRLTLGFANIAAYERFDPRHPTASRFVDEDLNRVWDTQILDGPRQSSELARARGMRPMIDDVDILLDLHSMLWPSDPLILSGGTDKGRALGLAMGVPRLVVADHGHVSGRRLIDYARFTAPGPPVAVLVEAGQHWEPEAVTVTQACVSGLLRHLDMLAPASLAALAEGSMARGEPAFAEVTTVVTANTAQFSFVQPFRGGDVLAQRNTLIALDGDVEIRTPHDDCLLVMPSLRPSRGHTAVRLARFVR
jgi:predicted deacylase